MTVFIEKAGLLALVHHVRQPSQGLTLAPQWQLSRSPLQWRDRIGFSPISLLSPNIVDTFSAYVIFVEFARTSDFMVHADGYDV